MKLVITKDKIIDAIRGMRDRDTLTAIIHAAENRDAHLAGIESDERRKRKWAQFSHLKKGDTVFIHKRPDPNSPYIGMYGKQLRVKQVKKRVKQLIVDAPGHKTWTLTALVADAYKLSEEPTAAAFDNALVGDETIGVARRKALAELAQRSKP